MPAQKKILVIKHGALGDLIFATGAFQALRYHHNNDHLIFLTSFKGLMEKSGYFDEIWMDDRLSWWAHPWKTWKLFSRINKEKFHIVYDLQRSNRTAWYFRIMQTFFWHKPLWSGTMKGVAFRYNIPHNYVDHIIRINQYQLETAGLTFIPPPDLSWMKASIDEFKLPYKYFLFVPGCSASQLHKRWPIDRYIVVANHLYQQGITPVIIGAENEHELGEKIKKDAPFCLNLMGKTSLTQVAELGRYALGALGHDTGPMHILVYAGCPSLLLFSYSSGIDLCGPLHPKSLAIQSHNLKDLGTEEVIQQLRFI